MNGSINNKKAIEPFFFGKAHRRLFGCCHYPMKKNYRREAVIICQTIGQEYIHSHRAIFQLAVQLASEGFMTLRFDYLGCGDSNGNFEDGGVVVWGEDVKIAIEEMQIRTGIRDVCLVGYRVGAALALKAAINSTAVKHLVLWEIVSDGVSYLNEAAKLQVDLSRTLKCKIEPDEKGASLPGELLGFKLTTQLIQDLRAIKLTDADIPINCKSLIIYNRESGPSEFFVKVKTPSDGNPHTVRCIEDHKLWENQLYRRLIPRNTIDEISLWIKRVTS